MFILIGFDMVKLQAITFSHCSASERKNILKSHCKVGPTGK